MTLWMLDTNTVSNAVNRRSPRLARRLLSVPTDELCVSAISYGETRFGLAQRQVSKRLANALDDFFFEVSVLPWAQGTAEIYGMLRATMKRRGKALAPLDMLIAAHALEAGATLISSDRAFRQVPGLTVEDWTEAAE